MGISELLRKLGPITEAKHISDFSEKTAAIDIMSWLYKGLYAAASRMDTENKSDIYLNYPLKMIALLKAHNITPIVVFDGKTLKEKEKIEESRSQNREMNIQKANYLKNAGNEDESRKYYKRGLKVKSRMLNTLIEMLRQLNIKIIVAPYEADSQIAYLIRKKYADFAISEDSDLIALGVKDIVFKLTPEGSCMNIKMENFRSSPIDIHSDAFIRSIKTMLYVNFLELVVMSGCDYLPSIKGFGLKTGLALFEKYKKMESVFHEMKFIERYKSKIPEFYLENAKKSVCMFFYQTVFDPEENKLVSLNSYNFEEGDDLDKTYTKDYINRYVSQLLYKKNLNDDTKNLKGKKLFKQITEKINYELNSSEGSEFPIQQEDLFKLFGEEFPNSALYCNGLLDMKTLLPNKKMESEKTFLFYKEKFQIMFFSNKKEIKYNLNNEIKNINEKNENNNFKNNENKKNNASLDYDFNEEEILRIINEDIENDENNKDATSNFKENNFLNKKRNFIENTNNNQKYDDERDATTPIVQSPQKNNFNMKFISLTKSNDNKKKKDLIDIIHNERKAESNSKNNLFIKPNDSISHEERREFSHSPFKYCDFLNKIKKI